MMEHAAHLMVRNRRVKVLISPSRSGLHTTERFPLDPISESFYYLPTVTQAGTKPFMHESLGIAPPNHSTVGEGTVELIQIVTTH